jgi:hypothetical protein
MKISIFGGISKFLKVIVFGQILAVLGRFAAFTVAESMPETRLKSLKCFNSWTVNPNATWSISLESYHPYLLPQKVSKNSKSYWIHSSLPQNTKTVLAFLVL